MNLLILEVFSLSIKAIGFDIGGTLVNYNKPLNWSASYYDAIKFMCKENNLKFTEDRFNMAKEVLEKYNTRVNPREKEVSSKIISHSRQSLFWFDDFSR